MSESVRDAIAVIDVQQPPEPEIINAREVAEAGEIMRNYESAMRERERGAAAAARGWLERTKREEAEVARHLNTIHVILNRLAHFRDHPWRPFSGNTPQEVAKTKEIMAEIFDTTYDEPREGDDRLLKITRQLANIIAPLLPLNNIPGLDIRRRIRETKRECKKMKPKTAKIADRLLFIMEYVETAIRVFERIVQLRKDRLNHLQYFRGRQERANVPVNWLVEYPDLPQVDEGRPKLLVKMLEKYENFAKCPICLDSVMDRQPHVTKCGHLYCAQCFYRLCEDSSRKYEITLCISCRAEIDPRSATLIFA